MENTIQIEKGCEVSFTSKKTAMTGKVVKVYQENEKTYCKIHNAKKYYYKQLKDVELVKQ
jgi:hypothetical protein